MSSVAVPLGSARAPATRLVLLLVGFAVSHASVTLWYGVHIDRTIGELLAVARQVPAGSNTLLLVSQEEEFYRVDPFSHVGQWLTIEDPSRRVGGLFSGGPNGAYLGHFVVSPVLYSPEIHWGRYGFPPLGWTRICRDYDFILLQGMSALAESRVAARATRVAGGTAGTLYRVAACRPATSGPTGLRGRTYHRSGLGG